MAGPSPLELGAYEYAQERIGVPSRTYAHYNDDESIRIHVAEVDASPGAGLTSYFTVGLAGYGTEWTAKAGHPLRFEFTMAAQTELGFVAAGLASCALNLATGEFGISTGIAYPNVFKSDEVFVTTPHAFFWWPFVWGEKFDGLTLGGVDVEWLTVVPITDQEMEFIRRIGPGVGGAGAEALIDAFETQETDIYDLTRGSVVLP